MSDSIIKDFKKFNAKNHALNDKMAKSRWKKLFDEKYTIFYKYKLTYDGSVEKYDHDSAMQDRKTGKEILVEFEMRSPKNFDGLLSRKAPYTNVHIPYRKIENKNKAGSYIVMGSHRDDRMIVIDFEKIIQSFKDGKHENTWGWIDGEWKEDTFVMVDHEDTIVVEINHEDKYFGPLKNRLNIVEENIFNLDVQYIAHQCNCLTSHSAGFAKEVFEHFPEANIYKGRSTQTKWNTLPKEQQPNQIIVKGKVINMMSQVFPGKPKYDTGIDSREKRKEYFKNCLDQISRIKDIKSIAFPYGIACNMGGGKWEDYLAMLENFAQKNPKIKVFVVKKP